MDKETLLTGFKKIIGNPDEQSGMFVKTGISVKTLDAYVENVALPEVLDKDAVEDAFYNRHVKFLESVGGQLRHEKADFVKLYEATHKTPEPKLGDPKPAPSDGDDKLMAKLKELEERLMASEKRGKADAIRNDVKDAGKKLHVTNENLWNDTVATMEVKDGATADTLTEEAKSLYEKKLKSYFGDGASPYGSAPGGGGGEDKQAYEQAKNRRLEFQNNLRRAGKLPSLENK